jgi:aminocarboxymuconate-semialdehyde decarboxylase
MAFAIRAVRPDRETICMPVIDIHTHMMSDAWLELLKKHGAPDFSVGPLKGGGSAIFEAGAPAPTLTPGMFDYKVRLKAMDEARVDLAVVSLTAPSVYWGTPEQSAHAARVINDDMRAAQAAYPDRIRWMATLPWQHPELALRELDRACGSGAVAVFVTANVRGRHLTEQHFEPVWKAIDERRLPVLLHPTLPPGHSQMDIGKYSLAGAIAFCYDTTLAVTRMVMDGFFERFSKLKLIAAHGGGTIPYVNARVEAFHRLTAPAKEKIAESPRKYFEHIYYDAVVYQQNSLQACIDLAGPAHVLDGSDYPHQTGDMPGCLARVNALPQDQRGAVRGANAQRLFAI